MSYVLKYIIYLTTNFVNDMIYVGVHSLENPDVFDGYLGSGTVLLQAIKKYGKNQFIRETLFTYETPEEAYLKEVEIVDEEFVAREDTYNLVVGGEGYAGGENHPFYGKRGKDAVNFGKHHLEESKTKISNSQIGHNVSDETKQKMSESHLGEKNYWYGKRGEDAPFYGNHHSEESKKKSRISHGLTEEIFEQRREDIKNIKKVWGWKTRLAEKWGLKRGTVGAFIKKYVSDLINDVEYV